MGTALLRKLDRRPRTIYKKNPLVEVLAAVQFPTAMALLQEVPAEFQRRFAKTYPLTEVRQVVIGGISLVNGMTGVTANNAQPSQLPRAFVFTSFEKEWQITLEPTLVSLTCTKYTDWPGFRTRFEEILAAVIDIYSIAVTTRLGLRYKDVINREALGLATHTWKELLRPELFASFDFFTDDIEVWPPLTLGMELQIPPGGVLINMATVINAEKQSGLLIDTDCFNAEPTTADTKILLERADALHDYTSLVFQACISDLLHKSLEPT